MYLDCIQSYSEICSQCFVNPGILGYRSYTVCIFFHLQILISWNRFARSLKEAFELYWETKQVCARGRTVFDIRWFYERTGVLCGANLRTFPWCCLKMPASFQLVHFCLIRVIIWKRIVDFRCTFHCFSDSLAGIWLFLALLSDANEAWNLFRPPWIIDYLRRLDFSYFPSCRNQYYSFNRLRGVFSCPCKLVQCCFCAIT